MSNNKEISKKLEHIKSVAMSYVYDNMDDEFQKRIWGGGNSASFRTEGGSKIEFTAHEVPEFHDMVNYKFVKIEIQADDRPFKLRYWINEYNLGEKIILSRKCAVAFRNGDLARSTEIKSSRNVLGQEVYWFTNTAMDAILPVIEYFSKDIETITPDIESPYTLDHTRNK